MQDLSFNLLIPVCGVSKWPDMKFTGMAALNWEVRMLSKWTNRHDYRRR